MNYKKIDFKSKELNTFYILTNFLSEHVFLEKEEYFKFVADINLCSDSSIEKLKSAYFIWDDKDSEKVKELQKIKYDTKYSYLYNETLLLMVVPTISCNCNCVYCQVNSKKDKSNVNDMSLKTALEFCDFTMALPHKNIKIEFQGGEPTLKFEIIKLIVKRLQFLNKKYKKEIDFIICTNCILLSNSEIRFIKRNRIGISTSIDGNKEIHDENRPAVGIKSSYEKSIETINLLRKNKIFPSALVTITSNSLNKMTNIIDAYVENKFSSIFIRHLNNYGCAFYNKKIQYSLNDYFESYKNAINYIIDLNLNKGISIREEFFSILLRKILTPFNDGFVDMQNPCALGQMCMIVTQTGDVYPSDESRMIAEMGDSYWKMGTVHNDTIIIDLKTKQTELRKTGTIDSIEKCKNCVYSPYCFVDPIKNYYIKKHSHDDYCGIKEKLFDFVFGKINSATDAEMRLFRRWANV